MARLRIGIDAHVVTGRFQGTRTTLTRLLRALARLDPPHDILVYADHPDEAHATIGPSRFDYRALGHAGPVKRLLRIFPRLLARDRVDVAVFQYNTPLWGRTRRVVFIHDILPMTHPHFFPLLNRLRILAFFSTSILRAALVVTVSDYSRTAVLDRYRLPPHKVRTVLNGPSFEPDVYARPVEPAAPRYILAVGRIEARKNVPLLVEAFRRADVAGLRLIVVGAFDLGFDYAFPDDPRIENRAGVDDAALVELYRGASLFVYPSAAEGFGIPLLDALLFGLPTISSDRTAMAEIGTGVAKMFDPTAPDAVERLASLIAGHFAHAPIPAPTHSQRQQLAARFSWDAAARQLVDALEAVAQASTP